MPLTRTLRSSFSVLLLAALAACGGGGGGGGGGPTNEIQCVPAAGGFGGNLDAPAGGDGGGAGGDGGGAGVGGTDGAIRFADVKIHDAGGTLFGTAVSDSRGLVTLRACGRSGPFRIDFEGKAGAQYFDEGIAARENSEANAWRPFGAGEKLSAWVPDLTQHRTVSAMTNAAAEEVARVAGTGAVTVAIVNTANEKIRQIFNARLEGSGVAVDDITRVPAIIDGVAAMKSFQSNARGRHAQALSSLSKAAAVSNPSLANPGREMTKQLALDLTDSVIDGRKSDGQPVATPAAAAYQPATFTQLLTQQTLGRLTLTISGNGGVARSGAGALACSGSGGECYAFGASVTLTPQPAAGYQFSGWAGACSGTAACTLTMAGDRDATATFAPLPGAVRHTLTVQRAGSGSGRVHSTPAGILCPSDCSEELLAGTQVTLTAAPDGDATFAGWSGACTGAAINCTVTMDAAKTVTASFTAGYRLTITTNGAGSVNPSVAGASCGSGCLIYPAGTQVTLTAGAAAGSAFAAWGGACSGNAGCTVTMNGPVAVSATFTSGSPLTVSKTGQGSGTVTSVPAGINCGASCSASFTNGTAITLSAVAEPGSTFVGWSGGNCVGTGSCTVTMVSGGVAVAAQFTRQLTLTTVLAGNGTGTVISLDGSISCPGACSHTYQSNASVTLIAQAAAGSQFTGWSGGVCAGQGACVLTVDAARTVTATFSSQSFVLNVTSNGPGSVQSSPAGISCPGDCSEVLPGSSLITLNPVPQVGAAFTGWSGDCTGLASCTLTMNGNKSATASFTLATYRLTGTIHGLLPASTGLRLANNANVFLDIPGGATSFDFGPVLVAGSSYSVTIDRQPNGQSCSVSNGSGTAPAANVTNVRVDCISLGGQWAWEKGSQAIDQPGVYGTLGVANPNNIPGARGDAAIWASASGPIWVFGGFGRDSANNAGYLNDLWRFDPGTRLWTWVSGSQVRNGNGVYGVRGNSQPGNTPGGRWGAATWIDANGKLWLFGGRGYGGSGAGATTGNLDDLWRFDPATLQWTWVQGSQNTVNNTQPITGNGGEFPVPRLHAATWRDGTGLLWLFGGRNGDNNANNFYYNDLWSFNPANNLWTLVRGSENHGGAAIYGSQGVSSPTSVPGARSEAGGWSDATGGFWVFGGYGRDSGNNTYGYLDDLWYYRPQNNTWTWYGGSPGRNAYEDLPQGALAPRWPGGRAGVATATGPDGRLWMFGGWGFSGIGAGGPGDLNELWVLDPSTIAMARVSGSSGINLNGVYGAQGVPSPFALPSGRWGSVMRFDALLGYLWLFGGSDAAAGGFAVNYRNDLWRFLQPGQAAAAGSPRGAPTKR